MYTNRATFRTLFHTKLHHSTIYSVIYELSLKHRQIKWTHTNKVTSFYSTYSNRLAKSNFTSIKNNQQTLTGIERIRQLLDKISQTHEHDDDRKTDKLYRKFKSRILGHGILGNIAQKEHAHEAEASDG